MRILFINLPYHGHVIPTIGLVQELIKQNNEVSYLMPFDWEEKVKESGAKFIGYQIHKQLSEQIKNAYQKADSIADDFDLIIYEQFFFLGKHLAEKHNKPVVRIFTAPATNKVLMNEFITAKGPLSIFKYKWIAKAFTKDIAKGIPLKTDNWLDEIIYNPPKLNLVYTLHDYQPYIEEFNEDQFKFVGPSIYNRKEANLDYIKTDRKLIYISLGTVLKGSKAFFQNCIDAFRDENVDVIISIGKNFKISQLKNISANIHIYPSVPQLEVLKMADLFITHGGMNSVSEALTFAIPMLVIPFVSDQPVNARCIERLGVGKTMEFKDVSKASLKEAITNILTSDEIKVNLNKVQQLIKEAPGNKGGAEIIMDYYQNNKL